MSPDGTFWNQEVETLPREDLEEIQTNLLKDLVQRAWDNSPFYRDLYRKAGVVPSDIQSLADVKHLPFTDKYVLQHAYPYGHLMVPWSEVREFHSATTPTRHMFPIFETEKDIARWGER